MVPSRQMEFLASMAQEVGAKQYSCFNSSRHVEFQASIAPELRDVCEAIVQLLFIQHAQSRSSLIRQHWLAPSHEIEHG